MDRHMHACTFARCYLTFSILSYHKTAWFYTHGNILSMCDLPGGIDGGVGMVGGGGLGMGKGVKRTGGYPAHDHPSTVGSFYPKLEEPVLRDRLARR